VTALAIVTDALETFVEWTDAFWTKVGAAGGLGVTAFDRLDSGLVPTALLAWTVNV
jgi:hypothetical protein